MQATRKVQPLCSAADHLLYICTTYSHARTRGKSICASLSVRVGLNFPRVFACQGRLPRDPLRSRQAHQTITPLCRPPWWRQASRWSPPSGSSSFGCFWARFLSVWSSSRLRWRRRCGRISRSPTLCAAVTCRCDLSRVQSLCSQLGTQTDPRSLLLRVAIQLVSADVHTTAALDVHKAVILQA